MEAISNSQNTESDNFDNTLSEITCNKADVEKTADLHSQEKCTSIENNTSSRVTSDNKVDESELLLNETSQYDSNSHFHQGDLSTKMNSTDSNQMTIMNIEDQCQNSRIVDDSISLIDEYNHPTKSTTECCKDHLHLIEHIQDMKNNLSESNNQTKSSIMRIERKIDFLVKYMQQLFSQQNPPSDLLYDNMDTEDNHFNQCKHLQSCSTYSANDPSDMCDREFRNVRIPKEIRQNQVLIDLREKETQERLEKERLREIEQQKQLQQVREAMEAEKRASFAKKRGNLLRNLVGDNENNDLTQNEGLSNSAKLFEDAN